MLETTYSRLLLDWIVPSRDARLARAVTEGILKSISHGPLQDGPQVRDYLGSRPLHSWSVNGPPAPDGALGFSDDTAAVAVEVKRAHSGTRSNATNWHARATLRDLHRTYGADDETSRLVYEKYLHNTDRKLDEPHYDHDCGGNSSDCGDSGDMWKVERTTGKHYPAVHQGDTYAATTRWIPSGLTASSPRDFAYLLISPSEESTRKFFSGLVSEKVWSVASLPVALGHWIGMQDEIPELRQVVAATCSFLPTSAAAA